MLYSGSCLDGDMSTSTFLVLLTVLHSISVMAYDTPYQDDLKRKLRQAELRCLFLMDTTPYPSNGTYCNITWDGVACWPYTRNGTVIRQACPSYVHDFDSNEFATRKCQTNGSWYVHPQYPNNTGGWSNYTPCVILKIHPATKKMMENLRMISKCGYAISLVSLVAAILLMLIFKKLHCKRNTIHINLFLSFILRAVVCLVKEFATVGGSFLPQDVYYDEFSVLRFRLGESHWQCKLLYTFMHFALGANYMLIFVEGLFLHTVIFFAVFSQKKFYHYFIIFGWGAPLTFVFPWVLVRIYLDDTLCWNTDDKNFYWIMKGPIVTSICVNFFFFLNIMRVLFTKLMSTNAPDPRRYRKLAKSTLILIPLFGVYYIIFICIPDTTTDTNQELTKSEQFKLYVEMTLNSFQGLVVAVLFCFLNGEVRGELTKRWRRHRLRRASATSRPSGTFSTGIFLPPRERGERGSISHQVALIDLHHCAPASDMPMTLSNGDLVTSEGMASHPSHAPDPSAQEHTISRAWGEDQDRLDLVREESEESPML